MPALARANTVILAANPTYATPAALLASADVAMVDVVKLFKQNLNSIAAWQNVSTSIRNDDIVGHT